MRTSASAWCMLVMASACALAEPSEPVTSQAPALDPPPRTVAAPVAAVEAPPVTEDGLVALLREVAAVYRFWGLVDETPVVANADCATGFPGGLHPSESARPAAHADKLFLLHAYDVAGYWRSAGEEREHLPERPFDFRIGSRSDVTQVLVKESFAALDARGRRIRLDGSHRDDTSFILGPPTGLFVMVELADAPPGTDAGWVYGTVAPDGEIISAGLIAKCVGCHGTQPDRVFGLGPRG